jgi:hypothetical protein
MTEGEIAARLSALEHGLMEVFGLVGAQQFVIDILLVRYLDGIRPDAREGFAATLLDTWMKSVGTPSTNLEREAIARTQAHLEGVVRAALGKLKN